MNSCYNCKKLTQYVTSIVYEYVCLTESIHFAEHVQYK